MDFQAIDNLFQTAEHMGVADLDKFLQDYKQGDDDLPKLCLHPSNMSLLHLAARIGNIELAEYLLKRCPRLVEMYDYPNRRSHDQTSLHYACAARQVEMAKLLLTRGADPIANGLWGTPLHTAAGTDSVELLSLLIEEDGVDVNQRAKVGREHGRGQTALHDAARYGQGEAVAFLLAHGADVNARYDEYSYATGKKYYFKLEERTALHDAAKGGHAEVAKLLLEHGAEVNASSGSKDGISTPIQMAMFRYRRTFKATQTPMDVWQVLGQHGADINVKDARGSSLLHTAAEICSLEKVKWLLEHGADANAERPDNTSVFRREISVLQGVKDRPRSKERAEVIALLKEHGARDSHRFLFVIIALAVVALLVLLWLLKRLT